MEDHTRETRSPEEMAAENQREHALWSAMKKDPVGFFLDSSNWPQQLSEEVGRMSTFSWAARHFNPVKRFPPEGEVGIERYRSNWPLPVGKRSLASRQAEINDSGLIRYHGNQLVLHDSMPFDGDERALWILETQIDDTKLELFGIARIDRIDSDDVTVWELDDLSVRLRSKGPVSEGNLKLVRSVRSWWKSLAGIRVGRGRPLGTARFNTAEEFHAAVREACATLERRNVKPKVDLLIDAIGISKSRYYDHKREWGLS